MSSSWANLARGAAGLIGLLHSGSAYFEKSITKENGYAAQATLLIDHATIESQGGTFHRPNSRKASVIDLAFSIGFRSLHWQDWSYLPGTGSDHEAVSLRAFLPAYQGARPLPPQFCTKKADWERFRRQLREVAVSLEFTIDAAADRGDFESVALSLQQAIEEVTNGSIPVKRPCDRSKAWWCADLTVLRVRYHRAFRRYKMDPSRDTETACKEARNSYFQAIDRAKTDHWFTFLSEASGKEIFTAYSYTKPRTDPAIPSLRYEVGGKEEIANSFSGKCEALVSTLFKKPQQSDHPPPQPTPPPLLPSSPTGPRIRARSNSKGDWQWPFLTPSEIEKAIPQKDTAPGGGSHQLADHPRSARGHPARVLQSLQSLVPQRLPPCIVEDRDRDRLTEAQQARLFQAKGLPAHLAPSLSKQTPRKALCESASVLGKRRAGPFREIADRRQETALGQRRCPTLTTLYRAVPPGKEDHYRDLPRYTGRIRLGPTRKADPNPPEAPSARRADPLGRPLSLRAQNQIAV
ncbi:reverse transcriptase [Apiospora arundinis]